jgi:6,7-dimethyl-8-ribityllumazine synthase
MSGGPHVLLVEAPYYAHIAGLLREGAARALTAAGATFDAVSVPGAFEIPAAIAAAARANAPYDGYVALGCVIRGETSHYDHICAESARALQDLAVRDGLAIGYGILTVENEAQALARAAPGNRDKGGEAVRACLAVIDIKRRFAELGS